MMEDEVKGQTENTRPRSGKTCVGFLMQIRMEAITWFLYNELEEESTK